MGDMGDTFREVGAIYAEQRKSRATQAGDMVNDVRATVDKLEVDLSGTWNITKGRNKIQFYPTKGTWQYRTRMYRGGIFSFINWLERL